MAETISQRQLRNDNAAIMRRVAAGESFVVTSNGIPVANVTPVENSRYRSTDEVIETWRNLPPIDYEQFRADLDLLVDQDPTPRV